MTTFLTLNAMGALIGLARVVYRRWQYGPRGIRRLENYANQPANRQKEDTP